MANVIYPVSDGRTSPRPLVERLDSFLAAFNSHVVYGKALLQIAKKHLATCEKLLQGKVSLSG
jgi:hypothetical protein